jgi:GDP-D-mannose 3', 5'-epimerase
MAVISVLGGGGFIGSNLVKRLVAEGHDVKAVDVEFPEWRREALNGAALWPLDLTDPGAASQAIYGADLVFHLAADMGGVAWFHGPQDWPASLTNGRITSNVLTACTKHETPRLVYTSSACAYATEIQHEPLNAVKLRESEHLTWGTPDAGYGWEKRYGLELCTRAPFDARVAICHTIYGPLQEHSGQRMKFPAAVITKALAARRTGRLELWGDGRQMRSYLFIDDAVDRLLTLAFADRYNGPVNVGASGAVRCDEVARMCLEIVGADAEVVTVEGPVGVMARDCDNSKWDQVYGEHADVSVREGMERFAEWVEPIVETTTRTSGVRKAVLPPIEKR